MDGIGVCIYTRMPIGGIVAYLGAASFQRLVPKNEKTTTIGIKPLWDIRYLPRDNCTFDERLHSCKTFRIQ